MAKARRQRTTAQRGYNRGKSSYARRKAQEMLNTSMLLLGVVLVIMTLVMQWLSTQ